MMHVCKKFGFKFQIVSCIFKIFLRFLNLLLVIAIKCNLTQFRKIGGYCNDYYDKFPETIKLKCGYDLDYIIKYV